MRGKTGFATFSRACAFVASSSSTARKFDTALVRSRPWQLAEPLAAMGALDERQSIGNRAVSARAVRTSACVAMADTLSDGASALRHIERGMPSRVRDRRGRQRPLFQMFV